MLCSYLFQKYHWPVSSEWRNNTHGLQYSGYYLRLCKKSTTVKKVLCPCEKSSVDLTEIGVSLHRQVFCWFNWDWSQLTPSSLLHSVKGIVLFIRSSLFNQEWSCVICIMSFYERCSNIVKRDMVFIHNGVNVFTKCSGCVNMDIFTFISIFEHL